LVGGKPIRDGEYPMLVCADVACVAALADDAGVGPFRAVGVELFAAVGLVVVFTLFAVETRIRLRADADPLAGV